MTPLRQVLPHSALAAAEAGEQQRAQVMMTDPAAAPAAKALADRVAAVDPISRVGAALPAAKVCAQVAAGRPPSGAG